MKKTVLALFCVMLAVSFVQAADAPKKSAQDYIKDLASTDEAVVIQAEKWLGDNAEKTAVDKLIVLMQSDKRANVRMNAAVALGMIDEKKVEDQLVAAIIKEGNADVRYAEVLSLSRIGITKKENIDALMKIRNQETDPIIKDYIAKLEAKLNKK